MALDKVDLAHRIHVLEAARHLLLSAMIAGADKAAIKQGIVGLCQAGVIVEEEAEALLVDFALEGA